MYGRSWQDCFGSDRVLKVNEKESHWHDFQDFYSITSMPLTHYKLVSTLGTRSICQIFPSQRTNGENRWKLTVTLSVAGMSPARLSFFWSSVRPTSRLIMLYVVKTTSADASLDKRKACNVSFRCQENHALLSFPLICISFRRWYTLRLKQPQAHLINEGVKFQRGKQVNC